MKRGSLVGVTIATLAWMAGCSLIVSTDGLTGASSTDAGAATDAPIVDASPAADSSAVVDAAADGAAFSCAALSPTPVFCDDFERNAVIGAWSDINVGGGGTLTIDPSASVSPTRSLLCTTPTSGDAGVLAAWMHHATFPATVSDIHLSFDENVALPVDQNQFDLLRLALHTPSDPASGSLQIAVTFSSASTFLGENDYRVIPTQYVAHDYIRAPAFGEWQHFALHVTLGSGPHVTLVLGNDTVVDADLTRPNIVPASVELTLGLYHSYVPGAAREVHLDNVVLDQQ